MMSLHGNLGKEKNKLNVMCVKYEPSMKWTMSGIKEKRFMKSSLQSPLKPDSKNTDQPIKNAVV